jgi:aldose 1-epimerase
VQLFPEPWVTLRSGPYTARLAPGAGGRLASLECSGTGGNVPLIVPCGSEPFEEHHWPKAGAFPMLPFANRLPAGGFRFGGRTIRPDAGPDGFAVHGFAHRRPWTLVHGSPTRAVLSLTHPGDPAWPWAWSARQEVLLGPEGVQVLLAITNESAEPMPVGMGWHPYHPAAVTIEAQDLVFIAATRRALDEEGRARAIGSAPIFRMERGETSAFDGWDGRARVRGPGRNAIAVKCEGASRLVLHRPARGEYLCVEPVTTLPGHLASAGSEVLAIGQTRSITWACGLASR